MALDVSPDLEAALCYLIVLGVGGLAALFQLYQKLGGFRGAWVMLETWALFAVYALIPVALFWLLDRTNAIHDTSVFGAVAVGVAYQQILSGQLSSIKAPEQVAGFWRFFSAWADRMAARIRDRIRENGIRFRDSVIASAIMNPAAFEEFKQFAMAGAPDPAQLTDDLNAVEAKRAQLGDRGVAERQARIVYEAVSNIDDYRYRLKDRRVISSFAYYWYAQEWRSKTAAILTAIALGLIASVAFVKVRTQGNELRYYLWRLSKVNATSADRFRTRQRLLVLLAQCPNGGYEGLAALLKNDNLPLEIVTQSTSLVIESAEETPSCAAGLPLLFVQSLWNANPDARGRIEDALVYLARTQRVQVPDELVSWRPGAQDSPEIIDTKIKGWQKLLNPGSRGQQQ